jgi:putative nucleotidyltransferase with HDIG domain
MIKADRLLRHPSLRILIQQARSSNLELYLVGGAVRTRIQSPEDELDNLDLILFGDVRDFVRAAANILKSRAIKINPRFDTYLLPLRSVNLEISGPKTITRSRKVAATLPAEPLLRDLLLRDFTINAIAEPLAPKHGKFVDPSGGMRDLERRLIRTPLDPRITLVDDPLRILRAARLASQLHFSLDPGLLEAMHEERKRLSAVSSERKTAELIKILLSAKPSIGLKLLFITGVLDVAFPEIAALAKMKQDKRHGHKDVFEHTLKVVDSVAQFEGALETRLAALLHDIGKPATRRFDAELGWTFHGHEVVGERIVKRLGREWKLANSTVDRVAKLVRLHMRPINLTDEGVTDSAVRRLGVQADGDIDELLKLCRADVTSSDPRRVKRYLENFERVVEHLHSVQEKDHLRKFQSPVRGEVIMAETGLGPCPLVGKLKKMIEEAILNGEIPNEYEAALEYLRSIKDSVLREASSRLQNQKRDSNPIESTAVKSG